MKLFIISCIAVCSIGFTAATHTKTETIAITQNEALKESIKRGADVYADFCITCHLPTGKGVSGAFPPLAESDYLEDREATIKAIKYGLRGEITVNGETYKGFMARLGLEDDEVADVMNYITNSWGNENKDIVTQEEVAAVKK